MPPTGDLRALSEAQLEILNLIWDAGECAVADVWRVLHDRRGVARNTVQTLMSRLEEKGWLAHRESAGGFLYRVTVAREAVQRQSVKKLVRTVFNGSAEDLVLALLGDARLKKDEAARIRKLIEQAKARKS